MEIKKATIQFDKQKCQLLLDAIMSLNWPGKFIDDAAEIKKAFIDAIASFQEG